MNAHRFDFSGARVLVTGGSNGIGPGVARAFAATGAAVAITGRKPGAADYPHDLSGFAYASLDVRDPAAIARVAPASISRASRNTGPRASRSCSAPA
jgi:NAD(P)-dependent dehydrogenase (short-subunit alcohol dehydrogenase family)